ESGAAVSQDGGGRGVAGAGGAADQGARVLVPLVGERRVAGGRDREGGGLAHRHALVRRLHGDGRRGIDGQRGGIAGDAAGGVADHHRVGAGVSERGGPDAVSRGGGAVDDDAVVLPLIGRRRRTGGGDAEAGAGGSGDRQVAGLHGDGRRHVHGED